MHCNVKLNYRDSGDGKVPTRVDTEQVSKIATEDERKMTQVKGTTFLSCDNMARSWHDQDRKEKNKEKIQVAPVKKCPHFHICICQKYNWTIPQ